MDFIIKRDSQANRKPMGQWRTYSPVWGHSCVCWAHGTHSVSSPRYERLLHKEGLIQQNKTTQASELLTADASKHCAHFAVFFFFLLWFFLNIDCLVLKGSKNVSPTNPLQSVCVKWGNVAFLCIAVTLQCDPLFRSQWTDTMSFYLVPKGPAQHFFPLLACRGGEGEKKPKQTMGAERWWLHSYCWRSPAHTRLFHALFCPSRVDLTGWHRPRTSWIMHYRKHTAQHRLCLVAHCLCSRGLKVFVLGC